MNPVICEANCQPSDNVENSMNPVICGELFKPGELWIAASAQ